MVILKHRCTGIAKEVKKGFSWTTLFFGFLVPLIRGDWKWAGIMVAVNFIAALPTAGVGSLITMIVFAVFYNKWYVQDLLKDGYEPAEGYEDMVNAIINN